MLRIAGISLLLSPLLMSCGPTVQIDSPPECDALAPFYCAYPWPSDHFMTTDGGTETGYRLNYLEGSVPLNKNDAPFDLKPYNRFDGFTPAASILVLFPKTLSVEGMATHVDIGLSLELDSPTVIIDLDSGERIAHWVEVDAQAEEGQPATFVLHPAARLQSNRSYAVALRNMLDTDGNPIATTKAFDALRDGARTNSDELEARRDSYDTMFSTLEAADINRDELTLAWWFHTASDASIQGDLLAMLEDTLERISADTVSCEVDLVEEVNGDIYRKVRGTYSVPNYMTNPIVPQSQAEEWSYAARPDWDSPPEFQGWATSEFSVMIPNSLVGDPANPTPTAGPLLQFGHGLMGRGRNEGTGGYLRDLTNDLDMVSVATDWSGMSAVDLYQVTSALADVNGFYYVGERLMQGMINQVVLTRAMTDYCNDIDELSVAGIPMIQPDNPYYLGISQGGIFGGTLMTISPDIERGALHVGAMSYAIMIDRSVDFYGEIDDRTNDRVPGYAAIMGAWYGSRIDKFFLMNFMQQQWDLADPSGWIHKINEGVGSQALPKKVLYTIANNDAQVPNVASDIAVRTMGIPLIEGSAGTPWGIDVQSAPWDGSGYAYINTGNDPDVPFGNEPPFYDGGSHGAARRTHTQIEQMRALFHPTGEIIMPCDGICDPD